MDIKSGLKINNLNFNQLFGSNEYFELIGSPNRLEINVYFFEVFLEVFLLSIWEEFPQSDFIFLAGIVNKILGMGYQESFKFKLKVL